MRFRAKLAIAAGKLCSKIIKAMHKGSGDTWPGKIALMIDPDILTEISKTVRSKIFVTMGTNGKTTTNAILYHVLTSSGKKAVINKTGSNMMNGIVSSFVLSAKKGGRVDADYACIEVDENASKYVLPKLQPDCIVLTNISRDQLDRFGEVDLTFKTVKEAIALVPDALLVVNCDDIISYSIALENKNKFITFGISEQIFDDRARSEIRESIFCRKCETKLKYDFFHYGQLGVYHCPKCGFTRPKPDYTAKDITSEDKTYSFTLGKYEINSSARTAYNIYNTLSAFAALSECGALFDNFKEAIESFDYGNNREDIFKIGNAAVQLHLAKNPIGFQQKVSLILKDKEPKDIIILINDGYQDGTDVSWLWDVDFEHLSGANAKEIFTTGSRRYDMALRLKYEDVSCKVTTKLKETIEYLTAKGTGNLYIIVNYTGLYSTNHLLHELENGSNKTDEYTAPIEDNVDPEYIEHLSDREEMKLTIGHLYPDLLNLYGDRGNIQCLRKRLEWRGIKAEVIPFMSEDKIDFSKCDIVLLGGGSDREQEIVCDYLKEIKSDFNEYVENGGTVIAVCGGYQLLGNYYRTNEKEIEGLGILDIDTKWEPKRLVGNIALKSSRYEMPVVGFENHGGRTYIKKNEPFGSVIKGYGNTESSGFEGVVYKNVIATYLHGPLLPKNPEVCDDLLLRALKRKYGDDKKLISLNDTAEKKANAIMAERLAKQ